MIRFLIIQEDSVISARESNEPGKAYEVEFADTQTGQAETLHLTSVEFGSILALCTGMAEDDPQFGHLYNFCQEVLDSLPPGARPAP